MNDLLAPSLFFLALVATTAVADNTLPFRARPSGPTTGWT
jgi:hypothetical protein